MVGAQAGDAGGIVSVQLRGCAGASVTHTNYLVARKQSGSARKPPGLLPWPAPPPPGPRTWSASLYAPAPPLAHAADGSASRKLGTRCSNCAAEGSCPAGSSPGARHVAQSSQAPGSPAQGAWSGGGQ